MTNTFNFTDRSSYTAWVRDWKATYASNSLEIRETKISMKENARAGHTGLASDDQMRREYLRSIQRDAIVQRHEAKVEAQRQYRAERDQREAA